MLHAKRNARSHFAHAQRGSVARAAPPTLEMPARRAGAAPPRDAREGDSAIRRLTYEHGGADALETVFSHLPWLDLVRARAVCRAWRDVASRDAPWKAHCDALFFAPVPGYHVRVARWDIGAVPAHAKALHERGWFAKAFSETVANRARTWLTADELSTFSWSFRFKKCAGMEHFDEWWQGGDAKRNVFARDGTCRLVRGEKNEDEDEDDDDDASAPTHGWAFAADVYGESASLFDPRDGAHAERLAAARTHPTSCWSPKWAPGLQATPKDAHYHPHWLTTSKSKNVSCSLLDGSHGSAVASLFASRSPPGFSVGSVVKVFPRDSENPGFSDSIAGSRQNDGSRRLTYPAQIVQRHAATWGWMMESCWTVATSFRMAKMSEEKRNRGDLLDRYLQVGFDEQAVEVENYHNFPATRGPHRRGAEMCPEAHVHATQRMTEVTFRDSRRERSAEEANDEPDEKKNETKRHLRAGTVTVLAPAALARWIATRPWNERSVETVTLDRTICLDERDALVAELAARRARDFFLRGRVTGRKRKRKGT